MQVLVSVHVRYGNPGIPHDSDLRRNLFLELLERQFSGQRPMDHLVFGKKFTPFIDERRSVRQRSAFTEIQMDPETRPAGQRPNTLQGIRGRWHVGHDGSARESSRFDPLANTVGDADRFPEIVGVYDQREAFVPVLQALVTRWWRR